MTKIINHTSLFSRRFIKTLLMVMFLATSMFFITGIKTPIYAAKLKTISGTEKPSEANILKINKSTLKSITWNSELTEGKDYKNGTYNDKGEKPLPALKINDTSKAQTYKDPFSMKSTETLELPTLSVDKETAKPGDTITYTVSQKIGTFYSTVLKPYDRIVFTDVIPKEVTLEYPYLDAKILDGNGNDITNQGKLTYDDTTRTLKFEMGDNWRNKESNYNGQTLKLVIKTTANRFKGTKITIPNQAKVSLSNTVTNDTNIVKTLIKQFETGDPVDKIQLQIRIPKDKTQQTAAHGKPTFIFKVTGKYSGATYYESVTFGDKEVSSHWTFKEDGDWIVAKTNKMNVPEDVYTAEYIPVSRFAITAKASEMVDVDTDKSCILFPFEASKDTWQYYSHNNIAINISMCEPR